LPPSAVTLAVIRSAPTPEMAPACWSACSSELVTRALRAVSRRASLAWVNSEAKFEAIASPAPSVAVTMPVAPTSTCPMEAKSPCATPARWASRWNAAGSFWPMAVEVFFSSFVRIPISPSTGFAAAFHCSVPSFPPKLVAPCALSLPKGLNAGAAPPSAWRAASACARSSSALRASSRAFASPAASSRSFPKSPTSRLGPLAFAASAAARTVC
jgi:hypothetical protein